MLPDTFRLKHERNHCVRSELNTHRPTNGLPCHAPLGADEDSVLSIVHRRTAVATRLIISLLKALQVRIKAAMVWKRFRQVGADLTVLPIQPGGKLRELDGMSISKSVHHALSTTISRRVCVFLPHGWLSSRERLPVGLSHRLALCGAERSPALPSPISQSAGRLPGPTQHSSTQFGILRLFSVPLLSVPRTAFLDSMVAEGTCPDRSCIKWLRVHHARHQASLGFSESTNVGHVPNQVISTLDGFGSRNLQVFAAAKHPI